MGERLSSRTQIRVSLIGSRSFYPDSPPGGTDQTSETDSFVSDFPLTPRTFISTFTREDTKNRLIRRPHLVSPPLVFSSREKRNLFYSNVKIVEGTNPVKGSLSSNPSVLSCKVIIGSFSPSQSFASSLCYRNFV